MSLFNQIYLEGEVVDGHLPDTKDGLSDLLDPLELCGHVHWQRLLIRCRCLEFSDV